MGWVSPTGFVDSSGNWASETLAYDENTGSYANRANIPADSWSEYLELTHAALDCDKVQFWASYNVATVNKISLDVFYEEDWHNIYEGSYPHQTWVEKTVPAGSKSVTAARVKFYNDYASPKTCYLFEFDFWEVPVVVAPTVTTQAVSNIGKTTATGNGTITSIGGENCDKRGVCWNTGGNPTVADDKSEETGSFGTGPFSRPMTGLDPGTHYYVRAYAHNSAGYGYGSQVEFTTTQVVSPSAISSSESFGSPTVLPGMVIISPSAIASLEAFGIPIVTTGLTIFPSSIPSGESFGIPTLKYDQNISPSSIPSAESFGTPTVVPGVVIISPSAIASLEAFGTPAIVPGVVVISPSAIASLEAFGTPYLVYGQTISPSAIASLEAFGVPTIILVTRYDLWTDWKVDAYAVAVCSYDSAVFAFRIDATDGNLYRCESSDNADNWGSWQDMGDVSGTVTSRLAACFKDADEAIVLYSIGGTLYRRRWNGSTWETAAAWSNSLSSITGIAVTYMGDWNVVVNGVDGDGRAGVWTCVLGNGYSAAVDTWSALKDVMIAESGSGISFCYPSLSMPDVFRMFFVETYSGSEPYSRPYWSHSLATADFISNLWREPIPFNLDSDKGLALCYKSPYVWLSRPDRVWRAPLTPASVEITTDVVAVSSKIIPYRGGIDITLRNDDRRFNSLGSGTYEAIKKASEILISWGYHTTAGKETGGFDPTTWIESWEYVTRGGQSDFILHTFDGWDLLERWRARRQFTWSAGSKNIYQLLALIFARAGLELSAFSTSTALVNQYPAFTLNPGESGLTAVKRLLALVPDVIFFVRDTAYLKNPLAADSSQYAYGTDHVILEGSYRELAQNVSRAQVFGDGVFTEDWDWDEIALVHDRLAQASDINIDSTTKAHQRGAAILRGADIEGLDGHILVPMNCGQDLFDVIAITSPQAGLDASKRRVISLTRTWTPNKPKSRYSLSVGLGAP